MMIDDKNFTGLKGTYVALDLDDDSKNKIRDYLHSKSKDIDTDYLMNEGHMTIVYSREGIMDESEFKSAATELLNGDIIGLGVEFEYWDGHDNTGYLVLKVICDSANKLNKIAVDNGAIHSFSEYTAHITVARGVNNSEYVDVIRNPCLLIRFNGIQITDINVNK